MSSQQPHTNTLGCPLLPPGCGAAIDNRVLGRRVGQPSEHLHRPTLGELQRVRDEIIQDLCEPNRVSNKVRRAGPVGQQQRRVGGNLDLKLHTLALRNRAENATSGLQNLADV